jgi:hypothetical protein
MMKAMNVATIGAWKPDDFDLEVAKTSFDK